MWYLSSMEDRISWSKLSMYSLGLIDGALDGLLSFPPRPGRLPKLPRPPLLPPPWPDDDINCWKCAIMINLGMDSRMIQPLRQPCSRDRNSDKVTKATPLRLARKVRFGTPCWWWSSSSYSAETATINRLNHFQK